MHTFCIHFDEFSASIRVRIACQSVMICWHFYKSINLTLCGQIGNVHFITVTIKPMGEFMLINDYF